MAPKKQSEISKIQEAAADAVQVVAKAAAEAKQVLNDAAANAINTLTTAAAVQSRDIEYIKDGMKSMNDKLDKFDSIYVTKSEFSTVRSIAFGAVALGLAALGAMAKVVFLK